MAGQRVLNPLCLPLSKGGGKSCIIKTALCVLLCAAGPSPAFAQGEATGLKSIERLPKKTAANSFSFKARLQTASRDLRPAANSSPVKEEAPILCEELSDNFCQTLYSSAHRGNFQFADGTWLLHGARREKFISHARFIHLQKTAESRCRMPDDLKFALGIECGPDDDKRDMLSRLGDQLAKLDSIPSSEREKRAWNQSLEQIIWDFHYIVYNVAYERSFNEKPELQNKFWRDYSAAEKSFLTGITMTFKQK